MIHWCSVNMFSLEAIGLIIASITGYLKCVRAADSDQFDVVFLMSVSKGYRKSQIKQVEITGITLSACFAFTERLNSF